MDMREHNDTHTDDIYALMMDALDGVLSAEGEATLRHGLEQHPALAREWQAMQAVDNLFTQSPMVVPAPSMQFAARTVERLPNLQARRWALATLYALLLMSGMLPVALVLALVLGALPADTLSNAWQLFTVLGQAVGQVLAAVGDQIGQQPAILGSFLVMVGAMSLWNGMSRQMMAEQLIINN